jgi:hypothetical protein
VATESIEDTMAIETFCVYDDTGEVAWLFTFADAVRCADEFSCEVHLVNGIIRVYDTVSKTIAYQIIRGSRSYRPCHCAKRGGLTGIITMSTLADILKQGAYVQSQALGEGEWPKFHKATQGEHWHKYIVCGLDDEANDGYEPPAVMARDNVAAFRYFEDTYNLGDTYEIVKVVTTYETVYSKGLV